MEAEYALRSIGLACPVGEDRRNGRARKICGWERYCGHGKSKRWKRDSEIFE